MYSMYVHIDSTHEVLQMSERKIKGACVGVVLQQN